MAFAETGLIIGGATGAAADNRTFERQDPITGTVATRASAATAADANRAAHRGKPDRLVIDFFAVE